MSATLTRRPDPRAVGGVLFGLLFIGGEVARGLLANDPLPLPGSSAADLVRYQTDNSTAVFVVGSLQALSALSLIVFAGALARFVRSVAGDRRVLAAVAVACTVLAGVSLLVSATLSLTLAARADDVGLATVTAMRNANFVTGGVVHVVAIGLAVGACTLLATWAKALPRGVRWLGYVASVPAVLSVISVAVYYASVLLPVGRMACFLWCAAAGIALLVGSRRSSSAEATTV